MRAVARIFGVFAAIMFTGADSLGAQPAPTMSVSIGLQGYRDVVQPEGGYTAEVTGGLEWVGRTRIEIGGTAAAQPGDCQLTCGPWHVESLAPGLSIGIRVHPEGGSS